MLRAWGQNVRGACEKLRKPLCLGEPAERKETRLKESGEVLHVLTFNPKVSRKSF